MKKDEKTVEIGEIVDMPLEEFKRQIIEQKVPIGVIRNLKLTLDGAYFELKLRKDATLDKIFKGELSNDDEEVRNALNGLYAEMIKLENKILFLKDRERDLIIC